MMTTTRKKLIEVALPLPEINDASPYDKIPVRSAAKSVRPDWQEEKQ